MNRKSPMAAAYISTENTLFEKRSVNITQPPAADVSVYPNAVLNTLNLRAGAITAGSFRVNGISITVDPTTDTLMDVIGRINDSDAGVTASYDTSSDSIRVVADTLGSRTMSFQTDTSNFLDSTYLTTATQQAGNDSQFTINGGPVLTRNTNEVDDAIGIGRGRGRSQPAVSLT